MRIYFAKERRCGRPLRSPMTGANCYLRFMAIKMLHVTSFLGAILQDDSLQFQEHLCSEIRQSQRVRKIRKLNPEANLSDLSDIKLPDFSKHRTIELAPTHPKMQSRLHRVHDGHTIVLATGIYEFASTLHVVASNVTFISPNGESIFRFKHLDGDGIIVAGKNCIFQGITFDTLPVPNEISGVPVLSIPYALVSVITGASVEIKNCKFARSHYAYSLIISGAQAFASLFHCQILTQSKSAVFATLQSSIAIEDSTILGADGKTAPVGISIEQRSSLRMKGSEIRGFASISVLVASSSSATLSNCKSISEDQRDALCAHGIGTFVSATDCEFSNSIEANVAALFGAHLEANNCCFNGGNFQSCVVQGAGSALHLRGCSARGPREACVSVSRGGHFAASDSTFTLSKEMQGIAAQGPGSSVEMLNCKIDSCKGTCVLALTGAIASLYDCDIMNSISMQGVCAEGGDSFVKMVRCKVKGTKEACVVAMHGGAVELDRCVLSESISSRGLSVEGHASSAVLLDCKIKHCATAAICALNGAKIRIHGGTFSDCRSSEGQGMCVQGRDTMAEIFDACFARCVNVFICMHWRLRPLYCTQLSTTLHAACFIASHSVRDLLQQVHGIMFCGALWRYCQIGQLCRSGVI